MNLHVNHLQKSYNDGADTREIIRDCSFMLQSEHTMSILGRSGCGKTTLLKILAGLADADAGEIVLDGNRINALPAHKRNIVYLYQEPLLFPHLTVAGNIAFGLRVRKTDAAYIKRETEQMLSALGLQECAHAMPETLSGGQKQRVAFGRAVILRPAVLLLDEPFGSLDTEIRASMQELYKRMSAEYRTTTLFVTHDIKEAIIMGDSLASMRDGRLHVYTSRDELLNDADTGIRREMDFWQAFGQSASPSPLL
jgi:ABC-type sugar transport system ATPase subunit